MFVLTSEPKRNHQWSESESPGAIASASLCNLYPPKALEHRGLFTLKRLDTSKNTNQFGYYKLHQWFDPYCFTKQMLYQWTNTALSTGVATLLDSHTDLSNEIVILHPWIDPPFLLFLSLLWKVRQLLMFKLLQLGLCVNMAALVESIFAMYCRPKDLIFKCGFFVT